MSRINALYRHHRYDKVKSDDTTKFNAKKENKSPYNKKLHKTPVAVMT